MTNGERLEFLKGEPSFHCRFHPTDWFHETGCEHMEWTKEQLLSALKNAKRASELQFELSKEPLGEGDNQEKV